MCWLARIGCAAGVAALIAAPGVALDWQLVQSWHDLSPTERYDAMQNYQRHEQLPQDRKQEIEERYQRWRSMPPDERDRIRQNYQRLQQLPPQQRDQFERKYEKWKRQAAPGG
jgi:hypothetical protein